MRPAHSVTAICLTAAFALLAACDRAGDAGDGIADPTTASVDTSVDAAAEPASVETLRTIPVTDELGSFASAVSGVALWAHPTLAYQSGVLAANGGAGLILVDLEKVQKDAVAGDFSNGVAVTYPAWADAASLIIAPDAERGWRFFDIDPEALKLTEWPIAETADLPTDAIAFCALPGRDDGVVRIAAIGKESELSFYLIRENDKQLNITLVASIVNHQGAVDCVPDDPGQRFLFVTEEHTVFALQTGTVTDFAELEFLSALPAAEINGIATASQQDQGQFLVATNTPETAIYGYDIGDGSRLGAFSIAALGDIDGVTEVSALAADGGNFGGIYRKGIIATVGSGDARTLKLSPLSTALRHWNLFEAGVLDRRDIAVPPPPPETAPQGPVIEMHWPGFQTAD